ncbi:sulfurtransferase complex subunit TusB [Marinobacter fonticola]|uniref:sulfurtransferase complex subunit TusB n=1 Tax=Marinobacter fonticola TaxID=2603215 RepID=UPI0011E80B6F|nr:sulfurtransferase complex subunit TusB [Marinobacter fonticola]
MRCLHILNKAPGEPRSEACLADLTSGDALLLIENAVVAIADNAVGWPTDIETYVLTEDLEARGLKDFAVENGWACVNYPEFVTLTTESEKVVCW